MDVTGHFKWETITCSSKHYQGRLPSGLLHSHCLHTFLSGMSWKWSPKSITIHAVQDSHFLHWNKTIWRKWILYYHHWQYTFDASKIIQTLSKIEVCKTPNSTIISHSNPLAKYHNAIISLTLDAHLCPSNCTHFSNQYFQLIMQILKRSITHLICAEKVYWPKTMVNIHDGDGFVTCFFCVLFP